MTKDNKQLSPILSRSINNRIDSSIISNNLLHSLKSNKLNQTSDGHKIDECKSNNLNYSNPPFNRKE